MQDNKDDIEDLGFIQQHMAVERTVLANERTLLSYSRSALAMFVTGLSIIHFSDASWMFVLAIIIMFFSVMVMLIGVHRFRKSRKLIRQHGRKPLEAVMGPGKNTNVETPVENVA